jgi:hypothetical protein
MYPAPRGWAERAYPRLIHYNKLDKGGHFAAGRQPRTLFRRFRAGQMVRIKLDAAMREKRKCMAVHRRLRAVQARQDDRALAMIASSAPRRVSPNRHHEDGTSCAVPRKSSAVQRSKQSPVTITNNRQGAEGVCHDIRS